MTGALSISSLLHMFGVRHNYVAVILYREGKIIHCVTCECDMRDMYFTRRTTFKQDFEWLAVVGDPSTSIPIES